MKKAKSTYLIPILSIAGSDCSGGAGIQADLKTFSAHNLFGMSVILSVVAENTARVISVHNVPTKIVDEQLLAVFEDIYPKAVKIGMIGSSELMSCVAKNLAKFKPKNVVIDPVMFAKNGFALMPANERESFKNNILQFADILTPNIPEAEFLCGFKINNQDDMMKAAFYLYKFGAKSVLIKGGHSNENADDIFYDGNDMYVLESKRIDTKNTHGTGCTLSSAIACNLALGFNKVKAVTRAKKYVKNAILYSLNLGKGCGPTNHFYKNIKDKKH
ncbi:MULTISPECIES: bifunctional hydroxymethylpyrimidine kinase/phosphomethylpyrimidine kinase [unclassified Campylobacter]|uniref:bifunctional hydroxymethylpyrimidine kinase/phosphomethylpyrimidine kinase n=1 Tax=unclassified Campylobacter TaxID=2593542 RepID=UPI001237BAF6|nr:MULTISPECIES: bifunctional hydroxymethylpyrimidine kinase/phosphomethylpyrimidine kinase [unclassified Campylobacter]KAA6225617.1 bifunctional hydroxymethylpyrimidine kinase/phosphomethylpyrimidine kinase [Campylobacter sp. LR185c]KAA6227531.1 bifunctional hydroxymethylpyrimidine kinase/phosphomethylpyrimidine kinase [Campylobacter sp. LR196d]KAA6228558.1 bifunctional hydroxymethylpyrimidine kinase/phosphomethylpyrimidine kinase [Campylobacter sp. LR286c]KAA6230948.1 bifunctional hydroxymeth